MAATKCIQACRCGREVQLSMSEWGRNVIRATLTGMIVGGRKGGLGISETADLMIFHAHRSLQFAGNGA